MIFEHDDSYECDVCIKIIGVGGGGNNAVNRMISSGVKGVDFITVNTDRQAFRNSLAPTQIVIGEKITKGFGAGANPMIGERAAEESINEIKNMLTGADMVFITAGMGGGTGTGAAPVIARVAQEMDILTVGIVTKPFAFERKKRMDQALAGIAELSKYVDSLIVVPNERLKLVSDNRITLANAFSEADDVLRRAVQSITELITATGYINLDFADVTSIMAESGLAHMGIGSATGKDKAEEAANMAISSPLLETSIKGATGVIISITASPDIVLDDVDIASSMISGQCNPDARVIFGVAFDSSLEDEMRVTIIATGFENDVNGEALNYSAPSAEAQKEEAPKSVNAPSAKNTVKDANELNLDDLFSNLF